MVKSAQIGGINVTIGMKSVVFSTVRRAAVQRPTKRHHLYASRLLTAIPRVRPHGQRGLLSGGVSLQRQRRLREG